MDLKRWWIVGLVVMMVALSGCATQPALAPDNDWVPVEYSCNK